VTGGGGWDVRTVARRRQTGGLKRAVSALPAAAVCFVSAVAATTNDATTCAAAPTKRRAPRRVGRWCHQDGVPSLLRGRRIQGAPRARRRPAAAVPPRRGTPPTPEAAGGRARRGASARRYDSTSGGADARRVPDAGKPSPDKAPGRAWRGSPAGRGRHWGTLTRRQCGGDEGREAGVGD